MHDSVVTIPLVLLATWMKVFGSEGVSMDPGIGSLIGNLGIMGVLVWHLWYHTTHSYPKMLDKFAEEQKLSRESFDLAIDRQEKIFLAEQEKMREAFDRALATQRAHDAKEQAELRAVMIQTLQAMRTAVHDVRDTSQQTMNKVAEIAVTESKKRSDHGN